MMEMRIGPLKFLYITGEAADGNRQTIESITNRTWRNIRQRRTLTEPPSRTETRLNSPPTKERTIIQYLKP
jgi:hypothetical protein